MKMLNAKIYEPGDMIGTMDLEGRVQFWKVSDQGIFVQTSMLLEQGRSVTATDVDATYAAVAGLDGSSPIEDLTPQLTVRSYNLLKREGVHTIGDMFNVYDARGSQGFLDFRNCGAKNANEIVGHIKRLRGEQEGWT